MDFEKNIRGSQWGVYFETARYYSKGQLFYQTKKLKKVYTSDGTDMIWFYKNSNMIY